MINKRLARTNHRCSYIFTASSSSSVFSFSATDEEKLRRGFASRGWWRVVGFLPQSDPTEPFTTSGHPPLVNFVVLWRRRRRRKESILRLFFLIRFMFTVSGGFFFSKISVGGGDAAGGDGEGECSSAKVELPEELAKSVVILTCESNGESGSCDVYLIGTAHVSKESCREVKEIISFLKPEAVFVELCSSRVSILQPQSVKIPTMSDMIESWKQKQNTFGILYGWFLAKIASQLEVFPGTEFRVAYEEALKYGGSVILGDRPVQITLKRTWAKMPLWHKVKFIYSLMFQAVFLPSAEELDRMLKEMDNVDMVTLVIQEMSKEFPSLMETLVHERDQYMASSLLRVASEHNSVVAVIGRGHINGIKKNWKQPITMKDLMEIPSDDSVFTVKRIVSSVAIAVAGTAIFTGILLSRRR